MRREFEVQRVINEQIQRRQRVATQSDWTPPSFAAVNKTCATATFLTAMETEDVRPLSVNASVQRPRTRTVLHANGSTINTSKRLLPFFSQLELRPYRVLGGTEIQRDVRESNAVRQYEEIWWKSAEDNLLWTVTANLVFTASLQHHFGGKA